MGKEQDAKKEKLVGLNRMDYETFLLALSDIANQLYDKFYQDGTQTWIQRNESQALQLLIRLHVLPLDEQVQMTEKGNNSQT